MLKGPVVVVLQKSTVYRLLHKPAMKIVFVFAILVSTGLDLIVSKFVSSAVDWWLKASLKNLKMFITTM